LSGPRAHRSDQLTRPIRLSPWMIVAGAVITAAMFAMLGFGIGRKERSNNAPGSRLALAVPTVGGGNPAAPERHIAITPDGSTVFFVTGDDAGRKSLAYQRLGEAAPRLMTGSVPSLESDLIARDGGSLRRSSLFSRLNPDDRTLPDGTDLGGARFQQMLRGRENALLIRDPRGTAIVRNLETGSERVLVREDVVEARAAAGQLIYARTDGTLWAVELDDKKLELRGQPARIGRGVSLTGSGIAQFAVSRNGNVAYVPEEPRWLVLVDRRGRLRNATPDRGNYRSPRFSPDGTRISVDLTGASGRDIWILSRETGVMSRATFVQDAQDATWTPDGRITYSSFATGSLGIFVTTGDRGAKSLLSAPELEYTGEWLRDGSGLVTTATNLQPGSRSDIALVSDSGRGPLVPLVVDRFRTRSGVASPDGKWIAYVSDRTGRDEVYVRSLRGDGATQVSASGGTEPVWGPEGDELFYRGHNGYFPVLVAVSVTTNDQFTVGSRNWLFPLGDMAAASPQANYDVSPDGRSFVLVRMAPAGSITVLRNVPELLERGRTRD
jgi:Tol biopolymer transport system component